MTTRIIKIAALAALCITAFLLSRGARFYGIAHAQDGERTKPYTVEMGIFEIVDGKEVLRAPEVFAQSSTGVQVQMDYAGGSVAFGHRGRVLIYPDGTTITLQDKLKLKTVRVPKQLIDLKTQAANNSLHHGSCEAINREFVKLRDDVIFGYPVTVVETSHAKPPIRITQWRAPDLGCRILQYEVERVNGDGVSGVWNHTLTGRATSIKLGEPDPSLFDTGEGYESVTLTEAEKRITAAAEKFQSGNLFMAS